MGSCGTAGPEMGFRENGAEFFRAGDYVLENVRFNNSPFSVPEQRIEKMAALGIDLQLVSPNPITYFYHQPKQSAIEFNKNRTMRLQQSARRIISWLVPLHFHYKIRRHHAKNSIVLSKNSAWFVRTLVPMSTVLHSLIRNLKNFGLNTSA